VQVSFFDPGVLGISFKHQGPDYRDRGVETSVIAVLGARLRPRGAPLEQQ